MEDFQSNGLLAYLAVLRVILTGRRREEERQTHETTNAMRIPVRNTVGEMVLPAGVDPHRSTA